MIFNVDTSTGTLQHIDYHCATYSQDKAISMVSENDINEICFVYDTSKRIKAGLYRFAKQHFIP